MDKSLLLFVQANDSWYNILPTIIPIDNKEISEEDLTKWDKEEKRKKKSEEVKLPTEKLVDLDQENQEPKEEGLSQKAKKTN